MPNYKPYGTKKETPSRKTRKGIRNSAFIANTVAARKARAVRKELESEREALRLQSSETEPTENL